MKKKGLIALYTLLSVFIVGIIATVVVIAVTNKKVNTDISMLYVAKDIEGTVSATYKVGENEEKAMTDSEGNLVVSFDADQPSTVALLSPKEAITLNKGEDLILTYTFTNTGEEYYTNMTYSDMELKNLKLEYCNNETAEYSSEKSIIRVPKGGSTKFSVKVSVEAPYRNATMEGTIDWTFANELKYYLDNNLLLNVVNNAGSSVETFRCEPNDDGTKFKIVGAVPSKTSSAENGNLTVSELTNSNGAEFYYFCTNPAVVGSYDYNTPGTIYWTSTADDTLENWYDIPDEPTTLYSCFMTPNFTGSSLSTNTESVVISNSVTSIGYRAFYGCTSLTSITIPNSVTSIGDYAFQNCTGLTSISIPASVTSIGQEAFENCTRLTSITIPSSVTSIGGKAFMYCSAGLEKISVDSKNTAYSLIDNCLIEKSTNTLILGCENSIIPSGVISIGDGAFSSCFFTNITIPNSVKSINAYAFYGCHNLTSVTIGNNVKSIGDSAFNLCTGLTSIMIPTSVESIGDCAFQSCNKLTSITIPDSVTSIGAYAFRTCDSLKNVTIGSGVTSIDSRAFYGCKKLTKMVIKCKEICTFEGCTSLESVEITSGISTDSAFSGCPALKEATIYSGGIGDCAFYGCTDLTTLILKDGVTSIGSSAFSGCTSLTSISIPNSVTSIGRYAFYNCSNLTSITIPDSVTSIGWSAFKNCDNLTYNEYNNVKYLGNETNNYVVAIGPISKDITSCELAKGTKIIYDSAFYNCTNLASIKIPDSVTSIGDCAFQSCNKLTSITIPDSVTSIGDRAFQNCTGLTEITIPDSVTSIGDFAFSGCTNLKYNEYGNIKYLGNGTNKYVVARDTISTDITNCELAEGTKIIYDSAFYNCTNLASIKIPNSVTSIGSYAFKGCTNLTSVTFEDTTSTWKIGSSSVTVYSPTDASTNATYLTSTYCNYYWTKNS